MENPSDLYSSSANYQFAGFEGSVSLISSAGVLPVGESFAVNMPGNVNEASCLVTMTASYAGITVGQPETMDFTVRLPDSYRVVSFDQNSAVCAFLDTALTEAAQNSSMGRAHCAFPFQRRQRLRRSIRRPS